LVRLLELAKPTLCCERAIIRRNPELVLVDELAHTNVPGSKNKKRYEDVLEILNAGNSVISTVNVQHLESLNDAVEQITGVRVRETVLDSILRLADEVELIDMAPQATSPYEGRKDVCPGEDRSDSG
jgi:two-component system sensor histidine kinase KdpD